MNNLSLKTSLVALVLLLTTHSFASKVGEKTTVNSTIKMKKEAKSIETTVKNYILGGDLQDVQLLEQVMHDNYRVIINDTQENTIKELNKSTYLDFIAKKVFGGDPRAFEIESIEISKNLNATVKLKMTSSKAIFYSQFSLVKQNEKWWLIQDLAYMEIK